MAEMKFTDTVPLKTRLSDDEVAQIAADAVPLPGRRGQGPALPQLPAGRDGRARDRPHRPDLDRGQRADLEAGNVAASYAGTTHMGKLGVELSYESDLHGEAGIEEMEVSAGGKAIRSLSRTAGEVRARTWRCRSTSGCRSWSRTGTAAARARWSRSSRRPATSSPSSRCRPSIRTFSSTASTRTLAGAQRQPRPAAAEPAAARHLPAGLDLQALHGAGRDPSPASASRRRRSSTRASSCSATTASATPSPAATAGSTCTSSIVVSSDTYYYGAAYEMGVDFIHDFMKPWGFGQLTGSTCATRPPACCRRRRGRKALQAAVVSRARRRRSASARATTASPSCSWPMPPPRWPTTAWSCAPTW